MKKAIYKYRYQYTMLLSQLTESEILSFMENNQGAKIVLKFKVIVGSNLSEDDKIKELESKIGMKTPHGKYGVLEFIGYEDLIKLTTK